MTEEKFAETRERLTPTGVRYVGIKGTSKQTNAITVETAVTEHRKRSCVLIDARSERTNASCAETDASCALIAATAALTAATFGGIGETLEEANLGSHNIATYAQGANRTVRPLALIPQDLKN